jgi:hypothetical protein
MFEGVLFARGRATGACCGFADVVEVGRKCAGHTFSIKSRSRTN